RANHRRMVSPAPQSTPATPSAALNPAGGGWCVAGRLTPRMRRVTQCKHSRIETGSQEDRTEDRKGPRRRAGPSRHRASLPEKRPSAVRQPPAATASCPAPGSSRKEPRAGAMPRDTLCLPMPWRLLSKALDVTYFRRIAQPRHRFPNFSVLLAGVKPQAGACQTGKAKPQRREGYVAGVPLSVTQDRPGPVPLAPLRRYGPGDGFSQSTRSTVALAWVRTPATGTPDVAAGELGGRGKCPQWCARHFPHPSSGRGTEAGKRPEAKPRHRVPALMRPGPDPRPHGRILVPGEVFLAPAVVPGVPAAAVLPAQHQHRHGHGAEAGHDDDLARAHCGSCNRGRCSVSASRSTRISLADSASMGTNLGSGGLGSAVTR